MNKKLLKLYSNLYLVRFFNIKKLNSYCNSYNIYLNLYILIRLYQFITFIFLHLVKEYYIIIISLNIIFELFLMLLKHRFNKIEKYETKYNKYKYYF